MACSAAGGYVAAHVVGERDRHFDNISFIMIRISYISTLRTSWARSRRLTHRPCYRVQNAGCLRTGRHMGRVSRQKFLDELLGRRRLETRGVSDGRSSSECQQQVPGGPPELLPDSHFQCWPCGLGVIERLSINFSDDKGWDQHRYYITIQAAVTNNEPYVLGRGDCGMQFFRLV